MPRVVKGGHVTSTLENTESHDLVSVATLANRASSVLERLRNSARSARADERREPIFQIGKAAELVGRTAAAIRDAEKDGRLPPPPRTENNRRVGYTLAQLNDLRGLFGTRPRPAERRVGNECVSTCRSRWSTSH